jgi:hypothetical protein
MKISLVSDLHLEFGYQELPGGSMLDITTHVIAKLLKVYRDKMK